MRKCFDTDAIVAIGHALNWEIEEGLRHLQGCDACRAQIETLQFTHAAFVEDEAVDADVLRRVSNALTAAARTERDRSQRVGRWATAFEMLMAGVTAVVIVISTGIEIGSTAVAMVTFGSGVLLLLCGRTLSRHAGAILPEKINRNP